MRQLKKYNRKVLLIGDTIVDKHVYSTVSGLSLESPTVKCNFNKEVIQLGGAANVAKHMSHLCSEVTFVTSMNPSYNVPGVNTINIESDTYNTKTRHWISRGDHTYKYLQINNTNQNDLKYSLQDLVIEEYDVLAISDYRCGLVTDNIVEEILKNKFSKKKYAASQVSSKENNYDRYQTFDCFVMNKSEAMSYTKSEFPNFKSFADLKAKTVYVTMGAEGCTLYNASGFHHFQGKIASVSNTIGAGDAFYAALLSSGGDVNFANRWASYYVSRNIDDEVTLRGMFEYEEAVR